MKLTGYSDRWSVRNGARIGFHVHCASAEYEAQVVRLRHGDESPRGPGFKEFAIESAINGRHPGAARRIRKGSYGLVDLPSGALGDAATVILWIWPTTPGNGRQGIATVLDANGAPLLGLSLDEAGRLELQAGGGGRAATDRPLGAREWHFIALLTGDRPQQARLAVRRKRFSPVAAEHPPALETVGAGRGGASLLLAAARLDATPDGPAPRDVFNGKIAAPRLFARALTAAECDAAFAGTPPPDPLAAWDFSRAAESEQLIDTGGAGLHGRTANRPARRMTGPFWNGDFTAQQTYDAIHFHDDDVADVGWPESFGLTIPDDWRSGVYAVRIRADDAEDYLPFFVCPPRGRSTNRIALLMPTFSYLAYSNESIDAAPVVQLAPLQDMTLRPDAYRYIAESGLKSTYDSHGDGSGICYASLRRPILDFRPKARCRTFDAPHQFAADLHLVDWLEEKNFAVDIVTDHDLHAEGSELLDSYRVVLTGSHPEYWSAAMIEARDAYLAHGGRLMYLGGNGFYWVTAIAPDDPGLIEIRRFTGTRTWHAEPGEVWLSLDGGMGGLWRDRGHAPQKSVGVGFTGQGFDRGAPYQRTAASHRPEFSFVFEGVAGPRFGAGPALVLNHGAAGFEVDKADMRLGTPAHAAVLASSDRLSDAYQFVVEETIAAGPWSGGSVNPRLGADIVLLEYPNGGAVFSVGSITWCSTLSFDGYDSDTSRITGNVLRAFSRADWRSDGGTG